MFYLCRSTLQLLPFSGYISFPQTCEQKKGANQEQEEQDQDQDTMFNLRVNTLQLVPLQLSLLPSDLRAEGEGGRSGAGAGAEGAGAGAGAGVTLSIITNIGSVLLLLVAPPTLTPSGATFFPPFHLAPHSPHLSPSSPSPSAGKGRWR